MIPTPSKGSIYHDPRHRLFLCIPTDVAINADELNALDLRVIDLRETL
jgi:hypothetical protein